jgi:hypothetical protein
VSARVEANQKIEYLLLDLILLLDYWYMDTNQINPNFDAFELLNLLAKKKIPLQLSLPYKGMAIAQELQILDIQGGKLTIQAPTQRVNYLIGDFIFLHSQENAHTMAGRLVEINLSGGQLILSAVVYLDTTWKERSDTRVEPKDPIMVDVRSEAVNYRACIENLSLNGAGLLAYKVIERGVPLEPQQRVLLDFELPTEQKRLVIRGVIANLHLLGDSLVRIGVHILPNVSKKRLLQRYILWRKNEIIKELEESSRAENRYPSVVNLYF